MMSIAEKAMEDLHKKNLPDRILHWACEFMKIDVDDKKLRTSRQGVRRICRYYRDGRQVHIKNAGKNYVLTRMCIIFLILKHAKMSLRETGIFINPEKPLDHSTMIHTRNKVQDYLKIKDEITMKIISFVECKIKTTFP